MTSTPSTPTGANPSLWLEGSTPREHSRLLLLAQRCRVRQDTTLWPWADVVFDLRLWHGLQLSVGQVLELVG